MDTIITTSTSVADSQRHDSGQLTNVSMLILAATFGQVGRDPGMRPHELA
jgi:hypothetical protein